MCARNVSWTVMLVMQTSCQFPGVFLRNYSSYLILIHYKESSLALCAGFSSSYGALCLRHSRTLRSLDHPCFRSSLTGTVARGYEHMIVCETEHLSSLLPLAWATNGSGHSHVCACTCEIMYKHNSASFSHHLRFVVSCHTMKQMMIRATERSIDSTKERHWHINTVPGHSVITVYRLCLNSCFSCKLLSSLPLSVERQEHWWYGGLPTSWLSIQFRTPASHGSLWRIRTIDTFAANNSSQLTVQSPPMWNVLPSL